MTASTIAACMWLFYVLASINIRVVAKGRYVASGLSDAGIATVQFLLIQRVAAASSWLEMAAYVVGGVCGGATGIYLTKRWYGE
jgi:hypothetical protein